MKKVWIIILLAMFNASVLAQMNLVPNPSFEDTVGCPSLLGQVTKAVGWYDVANTPDYFNSCSIIWQTSVPSNVGGYQYPHSGNAYMGLGTYFSVTQFREIIGCYLNSPLIIGQKYYVNFKVSMGYNLYVGPCNTATSKLGMLFSTMDYLTNPPPINNYSQIVCDTIIADTTNWTTIKGSFVADSAYSFISIGNFFDDQHTDTLHFGFWAGYGSYYYIDNVCISTDSLFSEVWTSLPSFNKNQILRIFPNPVSNIMHIENIPFNALQLDIIDINGKIEFTLLVKHNINLDINTTNLPEGLYIAILRKENEIIARKKFIKSNN